MIKTLLVDFGDVLGSDVMILSKDSEISKRSGLSQQELHDLYMCMWDDLKVGKKDLNDYFDEVVRKSHNPINVEELNKIHYEKIYVNPEMMELMKDLKTKGYRLILLSNESKEGLKQKIEKFHLHNLFEKIYCSAAIGIAKPDKDIFVYIIKDADISPETTLFIDDGAKNILTAKKLGFQTVLFRNIEDLKLSMGKIS